MRRGAKGLDSSVLGCQKIFRCFFSKETTTYQDFLLSKTANGNLNLWDSLEEWQRWKKPRKFSRKVGIGDGTTTVNLTRQRWKRKRFSWHYEMVVYFALARPPLICKSNFCRQESLMLNLQIIPLFSFLYDVFLEARISLPLPNSTLTAVGIHLFILHETILLQCFCLSHTVSLRYWTVAYAVPYIIFYLANTFKWGLHECCFISGGSLVSVILFQRGNQDVSAFQTCLNLY